MPGGDVSELTLRRLQALAVSFRRDRTAVAALYASAFPTTGQALAALEELLASPSPAGGRTRRDRSLTQLDGDTRLWAKEILNSLALLAAAETVHAEIEGTNSKLGSDAKAGSGDSSPASPTAGLSGDEVIAVAGHTAHGKLSREALIRRAVADPGQFVARGTGGDAPHLEPLHIWQTRAVMLALDWAEPPCHDPDCPHDHGTKP